MDPKKETSHDHKPVLERRPSAVHDAQEGPATTVAGMNLVGLTRQSVLEAIAEYDRLGQEEFLRTHDFGQAVAYWLEYQGRRYDSKAIAGVAHGYATGRPLTWRDLVGGKAMVKPRLEELGFRVVVVRNPPWDRREVVLACDLVVDNEWRGV